MNALDLNKDTSLMKHAGGYLFLDFKILLNYMVHKIYILLYFSEINSDFFSCIGLYIYISCDFDQC